MTPDPKDTPVSAATVTIRRTLDARQLDVRARILHAARQLINEQGHETVGMEAIAATAGVSRATMYRYFASKEHVVCDAALAWGQRDDAVDSAACCAGCSLRRGHIASKSPAPRSCDVKLMAG